MSEIDNVRVAVRVRPLVASEKERNCKEIVDCNTNAAQVILRSNAADKHAFTFNYVFGQNDTQKKVYEISVGDMLIKLIDGFNATILAYGQTGSGKTHTMGTVFNGELNDDTGIIPRAVHDIFERIEQMNKEYNFEVKCAFVELYQEQIVDLLSKNGRDQNGLDLRENKNGVFIPGLTQTPVKTAQETIACLMLGSTRRATGATAMNQQSSRSHAVFTITLKAAKIESDKGAVTTSKFTLVDLAGSERLKKTGAVGERLKEGVNINLGLSALSNVINALTSSKRLHIPYRESKLTRMLQDSLGGNSVTLMIACISPADYNVAESLNTLRYADRARQIKNKPIVNMDPHAAEINRLMSIISQMREELEKNGCDIDPALQTVLKDMNSEAADVKPIVKGTCGQCEDYHKLKEKFFKQQQQLQMALHDVAENEMRAHMSEVALENLSTKTNAMKSLLSQLELKEHVSTAEFQVQCDLFQQIKSHVNDIDGDLEQTKSEFDDHKRAFSSMALNGSVCGDDAETTSDGIKDEVREAMQDQADNYTKKQLDYKEQLRRIERELELKVELQQKVAGNLTSMCSLENIDEKFKECEEKIKELENERKDLLEKLRCVSQNNTAKIAEERRKRLQALEAEITAMKRTNVQQAKMLKMRENETKKVTNLNQEIKSMKEQKVKLIKAMRTESERFRQWKLQREKELVQLRSQGRKMQSEMVRKDALHTKQHNVLKRRAEAMAATNKRLKEALERQSAAQSYRQKLQQTKELQNATTKSEQDWKALDKEINAVLPLIDAAYSIELLKEERTILSKRIKELQSQNPADGTPLAEEMKSMQEELAALELQINKTKRKDPATELENHLQTITEKMQKTSEAEKMLNRLFKMIREIRQEYMGLQHEQKMIMEQQRAECAAAEERMNAINKQMRLMELDHENALAEREHAYEEKTLVLLRQLHNNCAQVGGGGNGESTNASSHPPDVLKIQEEQLNKMDELREELESYKQLVEELQSSLQNKKSKTQRQKSNENVIVIESGDEDIEDDYDDDEYGAFNDDSLIDPDWKKTPMVKRQRYTRSKTSRSTESISPTNETFQTAVSQQQSEAAISKKIRKIKSGKCKCRGNCATTRCGCKATDRKCTELCMCAADCINHDAAEEHDVEDGALTDMKIENITTVDDDTQIFNAPIAPPLIMTDLEETEAKNERKSKLNNTDMISTPTTAISNITFESASKRKKFF